MILIALIHYNILHHHPYISFESSLLNDLLPIIYGLFWIIIMLFLMLMRHNGKNMYQILFS